MLLIPMVTQKWKYKTNDYTTNSSPAIAVDGTIYLCTIDNKIYALSTDNHGLADFPWPKFRHNNKNTGLYQ